VNDHPMSADAAGYLMWLENRIATNALSVREALQRAQQHGAAQGRIEGLEIAKGIIGAKTP
jgi:predicted transposase YdaD